MYMYMYIYLYNVQYCTVLYSIVQKIPMSSQNKTKKHKAKQSKDKNKSKQAQNKAKEDQNKLGIKEQKNKIKKTWSTSLQIQGRRES